MKYAKFENEKLIYAPKVLKLTDGYEIVNPTKEHYLRAGYKEIIYTEQPTEDGFYFTSRIVNNNGIPIQEWERKEIIKNNIDTTNDTINFSMSEDITSQNNI